MQREELQRAQQAWILNCLGQRKGRAWFPILLGHLLDTGKIWGKRPLLEELFTGPSDKRIWYFQCSLAKNPPVLCAASPELHSFMQEPGEILDFGVKSQGCSHGQ